MPKETACECCDMSCPGCQEHRLEPGADCGRPATTILYRVDMIDQTGTAFCEACADDAFDSGLFTQEATWTP